MGNIERVVKRHRHGIAPSALQLDDLIAGLVDHVVVVPGASRHLVGAGASVDPVVARPAIDGVVAIESVEGVIQCGAKKAVVPFCPVNKHGQGGQQFAVADDLPRGKLEVLDHAAAIRVFGIEPFDVDFIPLGARDFERAQPQAKSVKPKPRCEPQDVHAAAVAYYLDTLPGGNHVSVVVLSAIQQIPTEICIEGVVASPSEQTVVSATSHQYVVARTPFHLVVTCPTIEHVFVSPTVKEVVPLLALQYVSADAA